MPKFVIERQYLLIYQRLIIDAPDITTACQGRWRGGHILSTSEIRNEEWPTTEEVLEKGTDISDKVLRYLLAISHY